MAKLYSIQKFDWGLNLTQSTAIKDNQFTIARNLYYNKDKQIETRRWFTTFGNLIGNNPITSYFHFQRDDNLQSIAICAAGTNMYAYDETGNTRNSIQSNLHQYETIPQITWNRTRWDFAVYKNIIYMGNGVDPYASYNWTTYTEIWAGTPTACTFDNTTDTVEDVAHWLNNWDEVRFTTTGTLPVWIDALTYYYVVNKTNDDFQISASKWWDVITFSDNGSGTHSYAALTEPRVRYVAQLADRVFGAWDDWNPSTLYYTNAAPTDWTNINQNLVVVGGDENGRINWLQQLWPIILSFKSEKIYAINVATPSADAIDPQTWWYSDRCIANVGNSLVYFNERGIDTLTQRNWVTGANAIESKPLSDDLRRLIDDIQEKQYNASAGWYIKTLNNYYFSFDTNDDNIPDTTLVYNSLVWAWTQYDFPNLYDYGQYINDDQEYLYLFASAINGQMYRMEYGFDDNWAPIEYELQTKNFDFDNPWLLKTFDFVDIVWLKSIWTEIDVDIIIDWDVATESIITDANIDPNIVAKTIWVTPIGTESLTWPTDDEEVDLYRFTFRVPMYSTGSTIAVNMSSTGWVRILEKMRISKDDEPVDLFNYTNIW